MHTALSSADDGDDAPSALPCVNAGGLHKCAPPQPKQGERRPKAYSRDELDALLSTARQFPALSLVTLTPPPTRRVASWESLSQLIDDTKRRLENSKKRYSFPAALFVTEFYDVELNGVQTAVAHFHIGFAAPLSAEQQSNLCEWWLSQMGLENNQGRAFDYSTELTGSPRKFQDYIAKEIDFRKPERPLVKYPAAWLPVRIQCRLWFIVGAGKRRPAAEGRKLRAREGIIRKRFEGEQGKHAPPPVRVSTPESEGEHRKPLITPEAKPVSHASAVPVEQQSTAPVTKKLAPSIRPLCPVCWERWGRSLWQGSCICSGSIKHSSQRFKIA